MSDATAALALMNLPGTTPGAGIAAPIAAKATASLNAQPDGGFSAALLALAGIQQPSAKSGAALSAIAAAGSQESKDKDKDSNTATAQAAIAQQGMVETVAAVPLIAAPALAVPSVDTSGLAPEAAQGFVAAAKANGAQGANALASGQSDDKDKTATAPGITPPAVAGLGSAPASVQATGQNAPATQNTVSDATNATAPAPDAGGNGTSAAAQGAPQVTADLASALISQSVQQTLQKDPATALDQARAATAGVAASSRATGTQSAVLEAARDLGASSASPSPATADPPKFTTPAPPHNAPEAPAPKLDTVAHAKPEPVVPSAMAAAAPSSTSPAAQDHAAATTNQPNAPQPVQDTSASAANTLARPETNVQPPQTMTVIRATETQNGVPVLPTDQIAVTLARQIRQGSNRFEIRLDPPELGRIDVRLDLGHNGRATASLTVDRPETLQLLTRDSRVLQQALSDAGLKADSNSLNFSLRDQSAQQQQMMAGQNQGQGQGGNGRQAPSQTPDDQPKPSNISTVLLSTSVEPGRLDMRV